VLPGLYERVIFRELFLKGLTLLDLHETKEGRENMSVSQIAARQELRDLLNGLKLPLSALKANAA
jgi:chromosome partitioning protein